MVHLFTAVAQAATDTVATVKTALPALPKELGDIPPQVWEKLRPYEIRGLLEKAMTRPMVKFVDNLVPIFFLLVVGFAIWLFVKLRSKRNTEKHERTMAMIEKGIYEPPPVPEPVYRKERYLLTGIILSSIGLAFLVTFTFFAKPEEEFFVVAFLFLFPGLGIIGFYRFLAKKAQPGRELKASQEIPSP